MLIRASAFNSRLRYIKPSKIRRLFCSMFYVYIIYSTSTATFYKGQTDNLHYRLKRHNAGYEKYTVNGKPWKLLWSTSKVSRSEAKKLEAKLKNLSRQRLLEFMLKYHSEVTGSDELLFIKQLSEC